MSRYSRLGILGDHEQIPETTAMAPPPQDVVPQEEIDITDIPRLNDQGFVNPSASAEAVQDGTYGQDGHDHRQDEENESHTGSGGGEIVHSPSPHTTGSRNAHRRIAWDMGGGASSNSILDSTLRRRRNLPGPSVAGASRAALDFESRVSDLTFSWGTDPPPRANSSAVSRQSLMEEAHSVGLEAANSETGRSSRSTLPAHEDSMALPSRTLSGGRSIAAEVDDEPIEACRWPRFIQVFGAAATSVVFVGYGFKKKDWTGAATIGALSIAMFGVLSSVIQKKHKGRCKCPIGTKSELQERLEMLDRAESQAT